MRIVAHTVALGLVACCFGCTGPSRQGPAYDSAEERAKALIRQLGSDHHKRRELAERELEAMGKRSLPILHLSARHADPEVRTRVRRVLGRLLPPFEVFTASAGQDVLTVAMLYGLSTNEIIALNGPLPDVFPEGFKVRVPTGEQKTEPEN